MKVCETMIKERILDINNFGPIKKAHIELKKLTVIAGINGSGKSTSSKLLSCFLTANSNEGHYLANKSIYDKYCEFVFDSEKSLFNTNQNDGYILDFLRTPIITRKKSFNKELSSMLKEISEVISNSNIPNQDKLINKLESIEKLLNSNEDENYRYFNVTNRLLNSEFNFNELIHYNHAHVHFHGSIDTCEFSHEIDFTTDKIGAKISDGYVNCLNFEDVIYIDSPSIFDFKLIPYSRVRSPNHLKILSDQINALKDESDVYNDEYYEKINKFQRKFEKLLNGKIYYDYKKRDFVFQRGSNIYSIKNTASGVKQIGIIQILLENRILKENSFVLIDEPEVNLHPEWQVRFAQILVLLIKELNITIYINSHSPQFIEALEVYSAKYGLIDESKFYLSEEEEDKFNFREIERNNLTILYNNLGDPYDEIDRIRGENIANHL